jgi:hypothetical protein
MVEITEIPDSADGAAPADEAASFAELLEHMTSDLPDEIKEPIVQGLRRTRAAQSLCSACRERPSCAGKYDSPPIADIEFILRHKSPQGFGLQRTRRLLFWPTVEDAELYVEVLGACPLSAPADSTHFRVLVTFMTPLYLHHCRQWSFCRPFILAGGVDPPTACNMTRCI